MLGGRIFAVGGDDGVTHLNSAECYDAQLNEWGEVVSTEFSSYFVTDYCLSINYLIEIDFGYKILRFHQSSENISTALIVRDAETSVFESI